MKPKVSNPWNPDRLDVPAFAQAGASLMAEEPVESFERLAADGHPGEVAAGPLRWQARAEMRTGLPGSPPQPWLHLVAEVTVPLTCQRCLGPVPVHLQVDRWYRFVADEATAEREDEDSEEDVLAVEPRPSLRALVEDECLMAMPLVPMHEACPVPLPLPQAPDGGQAPEKTNPFAQLQRLRRGD